jgi:ABC-type uncharacterized transport system permease subunit
MATQVSTQRRGLSPTEAAELAARTRYRVMGIVFIALGLAGYILFANGVDAGLVSTFGMNTSGITTAIQIPDWVLPSYATVTALSVISIFLGGYQLVRGFAKWTNAVLGIIILLFVFSFLTWATRGQSINMAGMLKSALLRSVPLTLGALSGILSERAGVVNIAIEGMMLAGAMVGALVGSVTHSLWIGLLAAIFIGAVLALFHGILSIRYKVDQIISGVVINIFATGTTSFISAKFLQVFQDLNNPGIFPNWDVPGLARLPFIGGILFENNLFVYAMYILLIVVHVALFYTVWGLRERAVGEHPKAADTLGIDVFRTRYLAVILSGMMAGLGGGFFTLGSVGRFDELMTAGRGFIALAAEVFGKWTPFGSFGASLIFGFAESLQGKLAVLKVPIASQFLLMAPYIATMIALAGIVGRTVPPAADGIPYEK